MKNKVLVISTEAMPSLIQKTINDELEKGWLVKFFYQANGILIITLYKEESAVG